MSSLKMTFSLTSLILIFAFGLVFFGTPVIADDGGTSTPAGGNTANHDHDGHGDQNDANTAENNNADHMHPQIKISAKDSDPTTAGIQVIPNAEAADADADAYLSIEVPVEITFPETVYSGTSGSNRPDAGTLTGSNTTGESFIGNESGGSVVVGTFALKAKTKYTITAIAVVTIAAPSSPSLDANKAHRAQILAATTPLELKVKVSERVITSSETRGNYKDQSNVETEMTFTIIGSAVTAKTPFTVKGDASVTDDFTVTFTADKADAELVTDDIKVTNGSVQQFGKNPDAPTGKTVYTAIVRPNLYATTVTVTIESTAAKAKPAEGDDGMITVSVGEATITNISTMPATANDQAGFEVIFTFNKALRTSTSLMLEHLSIGTMNSATDTTMNDMKDGDKANDTVTDAKDPMFLGTPNRVPGKTMEWRVSVSPKAGANTIIGLSTAGKAKFSYGSGVTALTVAKKAAVPTAGTLTAAHAVATATAPATTSISEGTIAANGFAVIDYTDLPDLEYFFDIGGTIGLHDTAADTDKTKNSRTVVISEILWGLDFGEPLAMQPRHQFIELYNTTNAVIDLKGWKLVFTPGNVRPEIDVDQVSNRGPGGWEVDEGTTGKSGRVAGTTADQQADDTTLTPARIVSMYRNITYDHDHVGTADRSKIGDWIPNGNAKGSWKNSELRSTNRWILSTPGKKHIKRTGILSASAVAGSPFIINEIGNDSNGDNDWVELHNLSDSEQSLKNYALTVVTAKGTDTELFDFQGDDWDKRKIPGKGYVVVSTRHPSLTDLATGKDIVIPDTDELNKGLKHLYVVREGWNLPDNGKFALILRNAHDKQGKADALIDVVATRQGAFADTNTSLWPLAVTGLPHENVIDGGDENFAAGKVYKRNSGNGRGDKSFAVAGYTGIGYDVKAAKVSSNHGTPGYANSANREMLVDADEGQIVISEIMFDRGGSERRPLPQWIEIHNSSLTLGVNLDGWKINIENIPEDDGHLLTNTFFATITLGPKTILPNQAVLIASSTGNVRDPNHFPPTRVVNLWTNELHREALEMSKSTDAALSTRGFSIELVNKAGETVDTVGNIDGDRKTRDAKPKWELPTYDAPDSPNIRSSILRIYDQGVPSPDGTDEDSWILASDTVLAFDASHAYYGNADDVGSPGYRTGGPLPVSLSKFRPERLKDTGEIVVRWITESELNNAGFNILRSEKRDGEFTKVHFEAGQGTTSERTVYEWKDKSAKPNVVYYYQIQDVSLDGDVTPLRITHLRGNVTAAGKLTTTWGEIKALR